MKINGFKIIEKLIRSKDNIFLHCEDKIFYNNDFIVVLDGSTAKYKFLSNLKHPSQLTTEIIVESINSSPPDISLSGLISSINKNLGKYFEYYINNGKIPKNSFLPSASFIALSIQRKEIWLVGDCQGFIGDRKVTNKKKIDSILSKTRSILLELEILKGVTQQTLLLHDIGRDYILPLLKEQYLLENNFDSQYGYPVINGSTIPNEFLLIEPIKDRIEEIILATDGYPFLGQTLEESEEELKKILEKDPLMFREYPSTKGMTKGLSSFDDRAYIRVSLEWE